MWMSSSKFVVAIPRDIVAVVDANAASYCEHSHCIVHSWDCFGDDDVSA